MDSPNLLTSDRSKSKPETFITRLREFSTIPRENLAWGRLYRDLTFVCDTESGVFSYLGKIVSYITTSDTFDQIKEFSLALSYVTDEIKRNDYQHLQNPLVKSCLPRVMKNLLFFKLDNTRLETHTTIMKETLNSFQNQIDELQKMIFENMPFLIDSNGFPSIDEEYFFQFFKDNYGIMMKAAFIINSLSKYISNNQTVCDLKENTDIDKLQKLLVFYNGIKKIKEKVNDVPRDLPIGIKILLMSKVFSYCTYLLTLPSLSDKQKAFFDFVFSDKGFSYTSSVSPLTKLKYFHKLFIEFRDSTLKMKETHKIETILSELNEIDELIIYLLPHLPSLIEDPVALLMLKDIITDPQFFKKLMRKLLNAGAIGDKLQQAGFLTREGENFCISQGWRKIIDIFIPDYKNFLIYALPFPCGTGKYFFGLSNLEVWTRFIQGSNLENYPDYLFHVALVKGEEANPLLMTKLLTLDEDKTNRIKHLLKFPPLAPLECHHKPPKYIWLILASLQADNSTYLNECYSGYAGQIQAYFYVGKKWEGLNFWDLEKNDIHPNHIPPAVDVSEEILLNTIKYINFKGLELPDSKAVLRVKYFPQLTLKGLKIFLERHPAINVEGLSVLTKDPRFSDFTLSEAGAEGQSEEKMQKLYVSLDILKRSSEYFRGMCASGFKESGTDHVELGKEDFAFFKRWMEVIYQPTNNFYAEHFQQREKLLYRLRAIGMGVDPMEFCVEQLFLARSYQMNDLFELLDMAFSTLITLPENVKKKEKKDFIGKLKRFDKLLKDKEKPSEFVNMVDQIASSQFIKTFNISVNVP